MVRDPSYWTSHSVTVILWTLARSISRVMSFPPRVASGWGGRPMQRITLGCEELVVYEAGLPRENSDREEHFPGRARDRIERLGIHERQVVQAQERLRVEDGPRRGDDLGRVA